MLSLRSFCMFFATALVAAPAARSQSPSLPSDSIYHLAVNPDEFAEEAFVQLVDEGYVKVEKMDARLGRTA